METSGTSMDRRYANPVARGYARKRVLVAALVTGVVLYAFVDRMYLLSNLEARGRHATGVVTAALRRTGRGSVFYSLEFEYHAGGGVHTGRKPVPRDEAERAAPGDGIDLLYDPASPDRHITTSLATARQDLKTRGYLLCAVIAGLWAWAAWKVDLFHSLRD